MKTLLAPLLLAFSLLVTPSVTFALEAGIAAVNLDMEIGIPLAGYGAQARRLKSPDFTNKHKHSFLFKPSIGKWDELRSKVMILRQGSEHLVFISVDTIGITRQLFNDVYATLKPLGIKPEQLLLFATHTHSGPGTLSKNLALNLIAVDLFVENNYRYFLQKIQESIHLAYAQMQSAQLFKTHFQTQGLQINKWRKKDQSHFDSEARLLLVKGENGDWLGGLVNYAMHGNGFNADNLKFSADVPGHIERNIENYLLDQNKSEAKKPIILWSSNAQGDVRVFERGHEKMTFTGHEFIRQGTTALSNLEPVSAELNSQQRRVFLGIPRIGKSPCRWFRIPLYPLFAATSWISHAQVGNITLLTWPGEPSTSLGYELKAQARSQGHQDPWIIALANDYMSYFVTREESKEDVYDSCSSLFGWQGGRNIIQSHQKMMREN